LQWDRFVCKKKVFKNSTSIYNIDNMRLDIYGFKADVTISDKWYIGEIKELHIVEQAKTLATLEKRLKEGVEAVLDAIKEKPSTYSKYISVSTFEKLGLKVKAYA